MILLAISAGIKSVAFASPDSPWERRVLLFTLSNPFAGYPRQGSHPLSSADLRHEFARMKDESKLRLKDEEKDLMRCLAESLATSGH